MSDKPAARLSDSALATLPAHIARPTYPRDRLVHGIAHIGVGAFHRAHQAVYLEKLLQTHLTDWAECGIGLMPGDAQMRDALASQDYLYTVLTRDKGLASARVVGCITGFLQATENIEAVLEKLSEPTLRIVSLTVTEGGYALDDATGELLADHPNVVHDLAHPATPRGVLGVLTAALDRRRQRSIPPFTVLSCDNLPGNGNVTKKAVTSFAQLLNPDLRAWIESNVAFPNSMVDGITPVTTDADRAQLRSDFGIECAWPVVTEPFSQWVLEDHFPQGRPAWEQAGATFVDDVTGYEIMKLRLLNAGHLSLAYLAALRGIHFVHDATDDPLLHPFLVQFLDQVTPIVVPPPGVSVGDYKRMLVRRFANPAINDQISRLCSEGSSKLPKFLLPSIRELARAGQPYGHLLLVVAAWCVHLRGTDENGAPFPVLDRDKDMLLATLNNGQPFPENLLQIKTIFGDVPELPGFTSEITKLAHQLQTEGATKVLQQTVATQPPTNIRHI